jgi:hypothetical protein
MPLTADRKTKTSVPGLREFPVLAGAVIFEGAMVSVDSSGWARPARTVASGDKCVGIAELRADNTGGSNGAITVKVRSDRVAYMNNSTSGDLIANLNVGADCFVVDDSTVALTNGTNTRVRAGKIHWVSLSGEGVAVLFDQ